jgi:hypothetical protein
VFYELSHDTLVAPILRSRKKRLIWTRTVGGAALALLVVGVGLWWGFIGRQAYAQQQTDAALALSRTLSTSLPDRNDPNVFLELLNSRLNAIEERSRDGLGSREGYAAMMFAAEDLGRRYPEVSTRVVKLRSDLIEMFNRQFGLKPVDRQDDERLNRRIRIEGGSFQMGSPKGVGDPDEEPQHKVTLAQFLIQEHEVTNAEYRRFDPSYDRFAPGEYPVDVSWPGAMAYAAWLGGSLPTEAQWEFAARGTKGRTYPWGENAPTCDHANFGDCEPEGLKPVKQRRERGKTPEGVYDLAGNAWEWCRDWYEKPYPGQEHTDPLGPAQGSERVSRGGAFRTAPRKLRGAYRSNSSDQNLAGARGFRVSWSAAGEMD